MESTSQQFDGYKLYIVTNKVNGKRYIGQTIRPILHRWSEHCSPISVKHSLLSRAIQKYGKDNFEIDMISTYSSQVELDTAERLAIVYFDCLEPKGYNLDKGGRGGAKSESTKAKMRISNKRNHTDSTKEKLRIINTGKILTEEHKQRISRGLKGKRKGVTLSDEHRANIGKASTGRVFSAEALQDISNKCSGKLNGNYGRKRSAKYKKEMSEKMKQVKKGQPRKKLNVEQVKEIKRLLNDPSNSTTSISKIYGVSFETIADIKKGKTWKHVILQED